MRINNRHTTSHYGFSIVEMIVYIAILSILVSAMVLTASTLMTSFVHMRAGENIAQAGVVSLERITREIRSSREVNPITSTLEVSPGVLVLEGNNPVGTTVTRTISLSGGRIMFQEGSATAVPLTHADITISNLVFSRIIGTNTEAVRVSFTASKDVRGVTISKDYRTFVVLDAS